jgi:parvulin-like peptidyl-prolyl isomerase
MSFRIRSALDRRHRPRWQDELRSQQLIVAGFAVAMAIAIGIFAASSWTTFYDGHLREVASVGGVAYDKDQLTKRTNILSAELYAKYLDLGGATGGANDTFVQQQLSALQQGLQSIQSTALDSLTTGAYMRADAPQLGISVSDQAISTEVAKRSSLALRLQLSAITVNALPANAASGAKPTDAHWKAAEAKAKSLIAQVKGGADFGKLAKEQSADSASAAKDGLVGWVQQGDPTYGPFFDAAKNGKTGDIIGPVKGDVGYAVLRVDAVRKAGADTEFQKLLSSANASDADYREYIRDELLRTAYQDYFGAKVVGTYMPQQEVAQIVIESDSGTPTAKERIRHILVQPIPGSQDQSKATPAQWAAALAGATKVRADLVKPNADWTKLAAQFSDDPGSKSYGGDLGWYDPNTAGSTLDKDFVNGMLKLKLDVVSQPVKTQFGYHIIEIFEQRTSAEAQAAKVLAEVKKDPSSFAKVAVQESSDHTTASKGGELGWVAPYEKAAALEQAIFGLKTKGQISDAVTDADGQIYIFKLLDSSKARFMDADRLASLKTGGYANWRDTVKAKYDVWTAPDLTTTSATG